MSQYEYEQVIRLLEQAEESEARALEFQAWADESQAIADALEEMPGYRLTDADLDAMYQEEQS